MPLDGTIYVADQLNDAGQILIDRGWCVGQRSAPFTMTGERCALGALDAVAGEMVTATHPAVVRLAAAIPPECASPLQPADYQVACFNNIQGGVDSILAWFGRAIAG